MMRMFLIAVIAAVVTGCAAPRRVFAVPIKLNPGARSRLMVDGENKRQVAEGRSGQDPDAHLCTGPSPLRPESK
jgi:hypothetical protein